MRWNRALVLVLLVVPVVSGCRSAGVRPLVQSPQRVAANDPAAEPSSASPVRESTWCSLRYQDSDWHLCNIHYHRPAEHGTRPANSRYVLPPCATTGTTPEDWVELHYAYVRGPAIPECDLLREKAILSNLGRDCASPYLVRSVWARVTPNGSFHPMTDALPGSASTYYIEYDGSSTGDTGGAFPAYWKINRDCLTISDDALRNVHEDETRELQPEAPPGDRPRSTRGH